MTRTLLWRRPKLFLSTLSLRRATVQRGPRPHQGGHFYPRSPCGERPKDTTARQQIADISIHALLAESDRAVTLVSVHPFLFLSTLSLRRATTMDTASKNRYLHFYPRSPCGERLQPHQGPGQHPDFYPRSPCGERQEPRWTECRHLPFLSTLSLRRATSSACCGVRRKYISIHALLAESDSYMGCCQRYG